MRQFFITFAAPGGEVSVPVKYQDGSDDVTEEVTDIARQFLARQGIAFGRHVGTRRLDDPPPTRLNTWTQEKPTEKGYYWWVHDDAPHATPVVVYADPPWDHVATARGNENLSEFTGYWMGPLPVPPWPQEKTP